MNKEDYVSLECAKLLKEKGFDYATLYYYEKNGKLGMMNLDAQSQMRKHGYMNDIYPRPTLYEVQKWLREKQNLFIEITYMHGNYYIYSILTIPTHDYIGLDCVRINSDNYEQCLNAGIIEALKLI